MEVGIRLLWKLVPKVYIYYQKEDQEEVSTFYVQLERNLEILIS